MANDLIQHPANAEGAADPRPEPPEPPLPAECCEGACAMCVWDVYGEQMRAWREALAQWRLRHPEVVD